MALSCVLQWLVPGGGYFLLGRRGRAATAFVGITLMWLWGMELGGELYRPLDGGLLAYLKTFACLGVGVFYPLTRSFGWWGGGAGDITGASQEFGDSFVWSAGLLAYLLILDVFDIAVGRKA